MNKLSGLKYNSLWQLFQPKDSFYCTPSEGQFLPFSSLLEADTIFYRAINKTWHFFFFFAITLWYVTGLWRQCYIIPHGFTASERDSWELLCVFTALPSNLSLCSLLLCSRLNGGLVKCIIYPCLPPWSGNHTKRGPSPWIQHCTASTASKVLLTK